MPKRKCTYNDTWTTKYPSVKKGRNEFEVECLVCPAGTFISVANKGALDVEAHIKSAKHTSSVRNAESCSKINSFFTKKISNISDTCYAVEGTLAFHTVRHHHSFRSMDCTNKLQKVLFKDSDIAKQTSCARTKCEAIINSVLSPHSVDVTVEVLKGISCFGLATDGSNHGSLKLFPILIQYFDVKCGGIKTKVVEIKATPNERAETIASYITDTLKKLELEKKCVAFAGDNTNTNFGGLGRAPGNNVLTHLKNSLKQKLVGMGCPAHVLHNCVQHGLDFGLATDVESIVLKIFNFFSIYTVRTEELKNFCDFVEITYQQLLSHSKTRWLSLFPCVSRLIEMYPALKSYFMSQSSIPATIRKFFEDELSEARLLFVQSLMSVFQKNITELEAEVNSVVETLSILESTLETLKDRHRLNFKPLKVKEILKEKINEGYIVECNGFEDEMITVYFSCIQYLEKWMVQYNSMHVFKWMKARTFPSWEDVEATIMYLHKETDIQIDDVKCFDQYSNFIKFLKSSECFEGNKKILTNDIWCNYFNNSPSIECHSELLKIAEFFFCIPSHNANVERLFSLVSVQWTKERQFKVETIKSIVCVQYNFKHLNCSEFHNYLTGNKKLLKDIGSSVKYSWYRKEGELSDEICHTESNFSCDEK